MLSKTFCALAILCLILSNSQTISAAQNQKEKWREPGAWGNEIEVESLQAVTLENMCMCDAANGPGASSDNQVAAFILRKFVKHLFSREKLEYDKDYSVYQRELVFTLLPIQLERLEKLSDPRDLDGILTEIFGNAHTQNKYNHSNGTWFTIFGLSWDIFTDLVMLLRFSEVQFFTFAISFIMIVWFIHRRHNYGIVVVVVSGFLIFGYFVTYLECNRELELKQMLEVIEKNEATQTREPRWYSPLVGWFGGGNEDFVRAERREQIKKASKVNLAFCRPDHVLMIYGNELFLKQLEFLIEKCTTTITSLTGSLNFPFNYIAPIGLLVMIGYMLKLIFKYILSPRVWAGYFSSNSHNTSFKQNQQNLEAHHEDRISGENLKVLLNALKNPTVFVNNSNNPTVSCVQELPAESTQISKESDNNSNNSENSEDNHSDMSLAKETISSDSSQQSSLMEIPSKESDFVIISKSKSKNKINDFD